MPFAWARPFAIFDGDHVVLSSHPLSALCSSARSAVASCLECALRMPRISLISESHMRLEQAPHLVLRRVVQAGSPRSAHLPPLPHLSHRIPSAEMKTQCCVVHCFVEHPIASWGRDGVEEPVCAGVFRKGVASCSKFLNHRRCLHALLRQPMVLLTLILVQGDCGLLVGNGVASRWAGGPPVKIAGSVFSLPGTRTIHA